MWLKTLTKLPVTACSSEGVSYLGSIYEEPLSQLLLDVKSQGQIAFDKARKKCLKSLDCKIRC